eukprot:TRINITY_DN434_c0_g1_i4.p1 TRINITY_DN434_c0_g1~~TRINITY_DN434_c0_g1_i4.p1  ORF type:complete len:385 (-),score=94.78 TRINITY_DN434_c0_g1_i4:359-1513(-)
MQQQMSTVHTSLTSLKGDAFSLRTVSTELLEVAKAYLEKVQVEDPVDRVEGHRFLLRMLSTAINARVNYDVDQPSFFHFVTPHFKMYLDSPDTDYQRCNISLSDNRVYRVTATIPTNVVYYGMQLYGPSGRIGSRLSDSEMPPNPQTRELVIYVTAASTDIDSLHLAELSATQATKTPQAVVLRGEQDDIVLVARQYFTNRKVEPTLKWTVDLVHRGMTSGAKSSRGRSRSGSLGGIVAQMSLELHTAQHEARRYIERVEAEMTADERADAELLWAQRVSDARKGFEELLDNTTHAYQMIQHLPANEMVLIGVGTRLCPTPDNRYTLARACLRPGRMLLLRGPRRPTCRYFSVCLVNKWLESLDYLRHRIYLNHEQISWNEDGL